MAESKRTHAVKPLTSTQVEELAKLQAEALALVAPTADAFEVMMGAQEAYVAAHGRWYEIVGDLTMDQADDVEPFKPAALTALIDLWTELRRAANYLDDGRSPADLRVVAAEIVARAAA